MKILPINDLILVKILFDEISKDIIIPDSVKKESRRGEILALPPDEDIRATLKVGEEILFNKYGGTTVHKNREEEHKLIAYGDIQAKIET